MTYYTKTAPMAQPVSVTSEQPGHLDIRWNSSRGPNTEYFTIRVTCKPPNGVQCTPAGVYEQRVKGNVYSVGMRVPARNGLCSVEVVATEDGREVRIGEESNVPVGTTVAGPGLTLCPGIDGPASTGKSRSKSRRQSTPSEHKPDERDTLCKHGRPIHVRIRLISGGYQDCTVQLKKEERLDVTHHLDGFTVNVMYEKGRGWPITVHRSDGQNMSPGIMAVDRKIKGAYRFYAAFEITDNVKQVFRRTLPGSHKRTEIAREKQMQVLSLQPLRQTK